MNEWIVEYMHCINVYYNLESYKDLNCRFAVLPLFSLLKLIMKHESTPVVVSTDTRLKTMLGPLLAEF
jgi:hypothetical protein